MCTFNQTRNKKSYIYIDFYVFGIGSERYHLYAYQLRTLTYLCRRCTTLKDLFVFLVFTFFLLSFSFFFTYAYF